MCKHSDMGRRCDQGGVVRLTSGLARGHADSDRPNGDARTQSPGAVKVCSGLKQVPTIHPLFDYVPEVLDTDEFSPPRAFATAARFRPLWSNQQDHDCEDHQS